MKLPIIEMGKNLDETLLTEKLSRDYSAPNSLHLVKEEGLKVPLASNNNEVELVPMPKGKKRASSIRSQTSSRSGDRADHQSGGGGLSNGIMEEYSYDDESDSPSKDIGLETLMP